MKRLLACAALTLLSGAATADWQMGPDFAALRSKDDYAETLVLMSSSEGNIAAVLVPGAEACRVLALGPKQASSIPSLEWNGVKIKMEARCLQDRGMLMLPVTKNGQSYVIDQISKNKDIDIKLPSGSHLVYKNTDGSKATTLLFGDREGL